MVVRMVVSMVVMMARAMDVWLVGVSVVVLVVMLDA